VYVGTDDGYISALGIAPEDVTYRLKPDWMKAMWRARARRRVVFAMNAGEIVLDNKYWTALGWQLLAALCAHWSGGYAVAAGIAVRKSPQTAAIALRLLLRRMRIIRWRDRVSQQRFGAGHVLPDWAFALGTGVDELSSANPSTPRNVVAVSMRGDRDFPPDLWFDAVADVASSLNAGIVVVVQVVRDGDRAQAIADRLGAGVLPWTGGSHHDHETRVRVLYRRSQAVISDRIHSLIIGMTEGAIPVGLTVGSAEKVARTFAPVTERQLAFSCGDFTTSTEVSAAMSASIDSGSTVVVDELTAARIALASLNFQH